MSVAWFAALVVLPVVIDAPGEYVTRCGERVTIEVAVHSCSFACLGRYPCGTRDYWHESGRLYFDALSANDIVSKADGATCQPRR